MDIVDATDENMHTAAKANTRQRMVRKVRMPLQNADFAADIYKSSFSLICIPFHRYSQHNPRIKTRSSSRHGVELDFT
jgi:hypothetical protein